MLVVDHNRMQILGKRTSTSHWPALKVMIGIIDILAMLCSSASAGLEDATRPPRAPSNSRMVKCEKSSGGDEAEWW
jgi:hypothetical protein